MKKAVILLSGGLDSATTLAIAKERYYDVCCISFDYGQKQVIELESAKKIKHAVAPKAEHRIIKIDLKIFGKSAITSDINIPTNRNKDKILNDVVPLTYVPARNTIFLSYALAYAEVLPANDIFIGTNILDYSGYPDCRPAYIEAYNTLANLAIPRAVKGIEISIHTPLMALNKTQIIEQGLRLGVDYSNTLSCYQPNNNKESCGECDACILRLEAFEKLSIDDPITYIKR